MYTLKIVHRSRARPVSSTLLSGHLRTNASHSLPTLSQSLATQAANDGAATHNSTDPSDSFLHGGSTRYLDATYHQWRKDPNSVHTSWQIYFRNLDDPSFPATSAYQPPPGLTPGLQPHAKPAIGSTTEEDAQKLPFLSKAREIIRRYREYGHNKATFNPLGTIAEVKVEHDVGLPSASLLIADVAATLDVDLQINTSGMSTSGLEELSGSSFSLREVIMACERIYCGSIGIELCHVADPSKRAWLCDQVKRINLEGPTATKKKDILDDLARGTVLERFLADKVPNKKRFGLDGLEAMVLGLSALIDRSVDEYGVQKIVLSQCHRGRLNMFSTVFQQSTEWLFRQFAGTTELDVESGRSGDVKYHYGMEGERMTAGGGKIGVEVLPNPSHLEATGPVAQGKTRVAQDVTSGGGRSTVMPIAMHTDGAVTGQGSVYEVLNLSKLRGYEVGGTIRITVNNQVGFTTDPTSARSSRYCTDIAKYIEASILHVNSDDPEAVVSVFKLAADWRARFQSDIMIDFVCYRRYGHNEIDQARFTQPKMYKTIAEKTPVLEAYGQRLLKENVIDAEFTESRKQHYWSHFEATLRQSQAPTEALSEPPEILHSTSATGVDESVLAGIIETIASVPDEVSPHRTLTRILRSKKMDFEAGNVEWATAEALTFGSLLKEGHGVRLSGEDVERGTFSQQHSVFHDQNTYEKWTPLNNLGGKQASYTAYNSPLSEFGVLGFDYGYSLGAQDSLTVWEAQFGDVINNAQVIVDQFIASGEAKWGLQSSLVLSLPHGYDGQGPEHSSARLGRLLELCNELPNTSVGETLQQENVNMRVIYPTTPANLFHALRRQALSPSRKRKIVLLSIPR